jgi:cytochrome d ubiquinol oxidase subunit II
MLLGGERRRPLRDHTYHAMGPVWEANHVWLIFVLVIAWTAYPRAFGSVASTLYVPLFLAAVGIILRGSAYALRGSVSEGRGEQLLGFLFGASSLIAPFALGTVVGALASRRVPVGNAAGDPVTSWLNPTSLLIGVLAVATSAYLAAVWLTADAARARREELVAAFRRLALAAAMVAGALAVAGVFVLHSDARRIFDGLTSGAGLAAVIASAVAGLATLVLVARGRFEAARVGSAIAVTGIVAGWAFAQRPELLPGLDVHEAAASDTVLVAVLVAAGIGALVLVPSLGLLFSLVLRGRFDERPEEPGSMARAADEPVEAAPGGLPARGGSRALGPVALALALIGAAVTVVTDGGAGRVAGVVLLLGGLAAACAFVLPALVSED